MKNLKKLMKEAGCYFLNADETKKLRREKCLMKINLIALLVGKSPYFIAKMADIEVPKRNKSISFKRKMELEKKYACARL